MIGGSKLVSLLVFIQDVDSAGKTLFWFPRCFSYGISSPFDKIFISSSSSLMFQNAFYFPDFFSFFNVRRWSWIILAIDFIFFIRLQQCSMEDIVDSPRFR